eukprot:g2649.t1
MDGIIQAWRDMDIETIKEMATRVVRAVPYMNPDQSSNIGNAGFLRKMERLWKELKATAMAQGESRCTDILSAMDEEAESAIKLANKEMQKFEVAVRPWIVGDRLLYTREENSKRDARRRLNSVQECVLAMWNMLVDKELVSTHETITLAVWCSISARMASILHCDVDHIEIMSIAAHDWYRVTGGKGELTFPAFSAAILEVADLHCHMLTTEYVALLSRLKDVLASSPLELVKGKMHKKLKGMASNSEQMTKRFESGDGQENNNPAAFQRELKKLSDRSRRLSEATKRKVERKSRISRENRPSISGNAIMQEGTPTKGPIPSPKNFAFPRKQPPKFLNSTLESVSEVGDNDDERDDGIEETFSNLSPVGEIHPADPYSSSSSESSEDDLDEDEDNMIGSSDDDEKGMKKRDVAMWWADRR